MDFSEKESDFLSEKQKQAINDALQNLKEGKIYTHERAMDIIKQRAPKYFNH